MLQKPFAQTLYSHCFNKQEPFIHRGHILHHSSRRWVMAFSQPTVRGFQGLAGNIQRTGQQPASHRNYKILAGLTACTTSCWSLVHIPRSRSARGWHRRSRLRQTRRFATGRQVARPTNSKSRLGMKSEQQEPSARSRRLVHTRRM
jgi:hypothetical protein